MARARSRARLARRRGPARTDQGFSDTRRPLGSPTPGDVGRDRSRAFNGAGTYHPRGRRRPDTGSQYRVRRDYLRPSRSGRGLRILRRSSLTFRTTDSRGAVARPAPPDDGSSISGNNYYNLRYASTAREMPDNLVAVIGSATRAYTLAVLAGSRLPLTAYRIAKLADLSPPNVYVELRRLAGSGIVEARDGGWVLLDDRVRAFCERRGPLFERRFTLEAKREWARRNRGRISTALRKPIPRGVPGKGPETPLMREFSRSPRKNALLRAAGLKVSRHKGR
jgi:DNA-binding transcriptional ArsR family regulator